MDTAEHPTQVYFDHYEDFLNEDFDPAPSSNNSRSWSEIGYTNVFKKDDCKKSL